jgi:hypothetical protein
VLKQSTWSRWERASVPESSQSLLSRRPSIITCGAYLGVLGRE